MPWVITETVLFWIRHESHSSYDSYSTAAEFCLIVARFIQSYNLYLFIWLRFQNIEQQGVAPFGDDMVSLHVLLSKGDTSILYYQSD